MKEYEGFLKRITNETWCLFYKKEFKDLAYLSLIAFLDGKIDREELFICHMVAEAYHELDKKGYVTKVSFHILSAEYSPEFLKNAGFPPFDLPISYPVFRNSKALEALEREKTDFLANLETRSPIKRTVISYTLRSFDTSDENRKKSLPYTIEMSLYFQTNIKIGFQNLQKGGEATIALLPPDLSLDLYKRTSSHPSIEPEHLLSFGYSKSSDALYCGIRMVSMPSPLFRVPYVHGFKKGPPALGLYVHDMHLHVPLDANNPDILKIIEVARSLRESLSSNSNLPPIWNKATKVTAYNIVDREAPHYRYLAPQEAFRAFIIEKVRQSAGLIFKRAQSTDFSSWLKSVLLPILLSPEFSSINPSEENKDKSGLIQSFLEPPIVDPKE